MLNLINRPDNDSLIGMLKGFTVLSDKQVIFTLYNGCDNSGAKLCRLSYLPNINGLINIDIKEFVKRELSSFHTSAAVFKQILLKKTFSFSITDNVNGMDSATGNFTVYGCDCKTYMTLSNFFAKKFLTLQDNVKKVTKEAPEFLTYRFAQSDTLKVKFYLKSGLTELATIFQCTESGDDFYTIDVSFEDVWKLSYSPTSQRQSYYDIFVVDSKGIVKSEVQRYVFRESTGREKYYLWHNMLGGIDTLTCSGECVMSPDITFTMGKYQSETILIDDTEDYMTFRQNTGYFPGKMSFWLWDFLASKKSHYLFDYTNGIYEKIVLTEHDTDISDRLDFSSGTFSYRKAIGDVPTVRAASSMAQQLIVTSTIDDVSVMSQGREITTDVSGLSTDSIECTGTSMLLYIETAGMVSLERSIDNVTWTEFDSIIVDKASTRRFDNLVVGSFIRVISENEITAINVCV